MKTWTDRLGHSKLRSFTDEQGRFWLEQNPDKASKWAKLARKGHEIAWEFAGPGGAYTGRMLIDGEIYTPSEATKKFLRGQGTSGSTAQALRVNEFCSLFRNVPMAAAIRPRNKAFAVSKQESPQVQHRLTRLKLAQEWRSPLLESFRQLGPYRLQSWCCRLLHRG